MNSEELEQSLRMEFETYLKSVIAGMRQESEEFQSRIEAEFDRQRSQITEAFKEFTERLDTSPQIGEAFREFSSRLESMPQIDEAFAGSVSEHLRLARDEGAKIAATAMAEAEKLDEQPAVEVKYDAIRDAVNDISSKDTQSAILKSLIQHAEGFAPRGAFFIIKNEHFAGWKVFGADDQAENSVREIHFPVSRSTVLGQAVESLQTTTAAGGENSGDSSFLDPLGFGEPREMMAMPLVARGRGVAVLYVDRGDGGGEVNTEALETIVRVAGLTVELLASMQTAQEENRAVAAADFEDARHDQESEPVPAFPQTFEQPTAAPDAGGFSFTESSPFDTAANEPSAGGFTPPAPAYTPSQEPDFERTLSSDDDFGRWQPQSEPEVPDYGQPVIVQEYEEPVHESRMEDAAPQHAVEPQADQGFMAPEPAADHSQSAAFDPGYSDTAGRDSVADEQPAAQETADFGFESHRAPEPATASPFDRAVEQYSPAGAPAGSFERTPEPVVPAPAAAQPVSRLSDRNVDLPIDVPEEERRLHNDARRFARLLVSEIKLYNEKKVAEGRQAHDLYERLREAIDRSREMYDKRVQPPVAAKFDYFHYELTNSLADGQAERLGAGYPGASV